jgi:hypothetical protein
MLVIGTWGSGPDLIFKPVRVSLGFSVVRGPPPSRVSNCAGGMVFGPPPRVRASTTLRRHAVATFHFYNVASASGARRGAFTRFQMCGLFLGRGPSPFSKSECAGLFTAFRPLLKGNVRACSRLRRYFLNEVMVDYRTLSRRSDNAGWRRSDNVREAHVPITWRGGRGPAMFR